MRLGCDNNAFAFDKQGCFNSAIYDKKSIYILSYESIVF